MIDIVHLLIKDSIYTHHSHLLFVCSNLCYPQRLFRLLCILPVDYLPVCSPSFVLQSSFFFISFPVLISIDCLLYLRCPPPLCGICMSVSICNKKTDTTELSASLVPYSPVYSPVFLSLTNPSILHLSLSSVSASESHDRRPDHTHTMNSAGMNFTEFSLIKPHPGQSFPQQTHS